MDNPYLISHSGRVAEQLKAAFAKADSRGVLPLAARAAKWIVEELERTPHEFGESRDHLAYAGIRMRIAFSAPLYAVFGIHEGSHTVFVGKIGWLERTLN